MAGWIYVCCCAFFGFSIVSFLLHKTIDVVFLVGMGSAIGIVLSAWIAYLLNFFFPLSYSFGLINIALLIVLSIHFHLRKRKYVLRFPIWAIVGAIICPGLFLFWYLHHGLLYDEQFARGAGFGDLPFHLNLITSFAYGCNSQRKSIFDLVTPFFAKEPLAYPFISNFYSAVILKCFGTTIHLSILIPSTFLDFALFSVLAGIVSTFSKASFPTLLAPWLFLFTGGLGFLKWIKKPQFRRGFYVDFVHNWGGGEQGSWFQTIIHVLLPQRASLHSLPLAHSIILILMSVGTIQKVRHKPFVAVAILVAALPQVQPHSIIACAEWGLIFGILSIFPFSKKRFQAVVSNYLIIAAIAIPIGVPQMTPYFRRFKKGFWRVARIWKAEGASSLVQMWWRSLGVFFVLAIFGSATILTSHQWRSYSASLGVWLISNYIWYQPWQLDNTKVFNAAWMPIGLAGASVFLTRLVRRGIIGKLLACLLMFFACFSGGLAAQMARREAYAVWIAYDWPHQLADWAKANSDPKSIWLLDDWHAHPITTLAGRQSVLGYGGWTASHGLGDERRRAIISQLAANPEMTRESDEFGIQFVCIRKSRPEKLRFPVQAYSSHWRKAFENNVWNVYQRTTD